MIYGNVCQPVTFANLADTITKFLPSPWCVFMPSSRCCTARCHKHQTSRRTFHYAGKLVLVYWENKSIMHAFQHPDRKLIISTKVTQYKLTAYPSRNFKILFVLRNQCRTSLCMTRLRFCEMTEDRSCFFVEFVTAVL